MIGFGLQDIYPGNGLYLDLDGSTSQAARLETKTEFALEAGLYEFSFLLGNNRNTLETMTVSLGNAYTEIFERSTIMTEFELITRSIVVNDTTNARLVFDHDGGDGGGFIIDAVTLTAVPEPNTCFLMTVAIAGMTALRRRRVSRCRA